MFDAYASCKAKANNPNMGAPGHFANLANKWAENLESYIKAHVPSGSGFDSGTAFNFNESTPNRLVFNTAFHHMDDNGCYTKWTHHKVILAPAFRGFDLKVTGPNFRDIKEYIGDMFADCLGS